MRRDPPVREEREGTPLPMRATAIVLSVWVFVLVIAAFLLVPLVFATCLPPAAPGGPGP